MKTLILTAIAALFLATGTVYGAAKDIADERMLRKLNAEIIARCLRDHPYLNAKARTPREIAVRCDYLMR